MSFLNFSARMAARLYSNRINSWKSRAVEMQDRVFRQLLRKGRDTGFGRDHSFSSVRTYEQFANMVPVRDYEGLRSYIGRVRLGHRSVLWPGRPIYFAMTSGTTSGGKYIPITRDSIPNHIGSTRLALLNYIRKTGNAGFVDGNYIFLSGSPLLKDENGIPSGRLSGIVNHHVPSYLRRNQLPSWEVNCIEDWERKLDAIVDQTVDRNMTLISGIPPWVEMYFEKLIRQSGKASIKEVFPEFSLFIYGGVNFEPYEGKFRKLIGGDHVDSLETFPASEGFMAFQDEFPSEGLILIPDAGIFYEFIPLDKFHDDKPGRIPLEGVETGVNYVMILNTNAGMWGYNIGDTVRFVSKDPYRILVTGRVSQFTSAFGEHVIAEEADSAIVETCKKTGARISEFTVAPLFDYQGGKPCHEWFIEFEKLPSDMDAFAGELDRQMRRRNSYYDDLVKGNIIQSLVVRIVPENGFAKYMNSIGKLGGQNKVPRLRNDREIADILRTYI
ncbi:MAG: hypothetical protein EA408_01600 [Marinilabiliales bacterium]|nr:MAG: hypothetical protein EA408_01600 [Marinilabiliales bacterium]